MSRDGNGGSVMLAFMLGAMAGAAVALLFAPAAGEETRETSGGVPARGATAPVTRPATPPITAASSTSASGTA